MSTVGINHMADWSATEYKKLLGYKHELKAASKTTFNYAELDTSNLAGSVNWVTKDAATTVKNQEQCGSCWAFYAVEGADFLANGKLQSFSERQVADCDKVDQGCNGGPMDLINIWIDAGEQRENYSRS